MNDRTVRLNKKLHKHKNNKKIIFRLVIPLVLIFIIIFFILNSSFFNIEKINVLNNKLLKKDEIIKISKIKKNLNIFKINSLDIQGRLTSDPFIKSASIKKTLPNTVNIDIIEREKTFILEYLSIYLLVDDEGIVMDHLEDSKVELPLVKGFSSDISETGENIFSSGQNNNLQDFIYEGKKLSLLVEIDEVEKDFANDINIKLNNGILVAFGPLNNVEYKLSLLKEILEDIDKKSIKAKEIVMNKGSHPILILDD